MFHMLCHLYLTSLTAWDLPVSSYWQQPDELLLTSTTAFKLFTSNLELIKRDGYSKGILRLMCSISKGWSSSISYPRGIIRRLVHLHDYSHRETHCLIEFFLIHLQLAIEQLPLTKFSITQNACEKVLKMYFPTQSIYPLYEQNFNRSCSYCNGYQLYTNNRLSHMTWTYRWTSKSTTLSVAFHWTMQHYSMRVPHFLAI